MKPSNHERSPRNKTWEKWLLGTLKFALTVICAALLSVYLQDHMGNLRTASSSSNTKHLELAQNSAPQQVNEKIPVDDMEELYKSNLEKIFRTLRHKANVRMVKL